MRHDQRPSHLTRVGATLLAGLLALPAGSLLAADGEIVLAQAQDRDQDRDRDRDRDWSDADRDRIRDRLRDGSCEEVAEATSEVLEVVRPCLDRDRLRDGSCMDRVNLGLQALERTRDRCEGN